MGISNFIADIENSIKPVVVNDERRKEALGTIKAMKKRIKAHKKDVKQITKAVKKGFSEHEVQSEEVDKLWDQYIDQIGETSRDLIDLRFQLKDQLTRDEWEQVFSEAGEASSGSSSGSTDFEMYVLTEGGASATATARVIRVKINTELTENN